MQSLYAEPDCFNYDEVQWNDTHKDIHIWLADPYASCGHLVPPASHTAVLLLCREGYDDWSQVSTGERHSAFLGCSGRHALHYPCPLNSQSVSLRTFTGGGLHFPFVSSQQKLDVCPSVANGDIHCRVSSEETYLWSSSRCTRWKFLFVPFSCILCSSFNGGGCYFKEYAKQMLFRQGSCILLHSLQW